MSRRRSTRSPTTRTPSSRGTTRRARGPVLDKLYEKAKHSQWNGQTDLAWPIEVDHEQLVAQMWGTDPGFGVMGIDVSGTPMATWGSKEWLEWQMAQENWTLSQFMHGEQGALICTAKIVETVPWIDAKYYAATQVMDEARHVEVFAQYLDTKLSGHYPLNPHLGMLLDDIIDDSRWDMTYLGMQIMVEGLALTAFSLMHHSTQEPLLKKLLRYVMSDEARHVAFGVLSLKEYYDELSADEIHERQEFAFEAALRMRDRLLMQEVWEGMGVDPKQAILTMREGRHPGPLRPDVVLQDRAQLQEARPPRRRGRLAAHEVHRDRGDPVRGLDQHR